MDWILETFDAIWARLTFRLGVLICCRTCRWATSAATELKGQCNYFLLTLFDNSDLVFVKEGVTSPCWGRAGTWPLPLVSLTPSPEPLLLDLNQLAFLYCEVRCLQFTLPRGAHHSEIHKWVLPPKKERNRAASRWNLPHLDLSLEKCI